MTGPDEHGLLFLKPGQIMVSSVPLLVTTLLGSCVAVTMFSARHCLGAICHAQLPACGNAHCNPARLDAGKYVQCAISQMLERLSAQGVAREEIQAKLFGGAEMFDTMQGGRGRSVGRQNIEMALRMLERESIRVVRQDLGGERGRKIIFHTDTGVVFLKRLSKTRTH